MTEDHEKQSLAVENALLRGALFLAAKSLKRYRDAPHCEIEAKGDGTTMFEVVVPDETRTRAADAIARAEAMLKSQGEGQTR